MYIENNPLRLVRIGDMYGKVLEDVTTKVKDIAGAYVGESFILTTSDEVYDKVFDVIEEVFRQSDLVVGVIVHRLIQNSRKNGIR